LNRALAALCVPCGRRYNLKAPIEGVSWWGLVLGTGEKRLTDLIDPANTMPLEQWLDALEEIAEDRGYFEPLGPDHSATFIEGNKSLLVTFETIETVRGRSKSDVPLGWEFAENQGWSQLCLISHKETWFRHRAVYSFFDGLVDDGFFDDFDSVVFYGAETCGYAAAAYSVVAPGATVIALSPQASLDPRICEWDDRFVFMRRTSFTDRYGYAPAMLEAAENAFILYDPEIEADAMHAALFNAPNIQRIRCRHLHDEIEAYLRRMGLLEELLFKAMAGNLRSLDFFAALRDRRNYLPYLRNFLGAVENAERPFLTAVMCRNVLSRINAPRFRRQLGIAQQELKRRGKHVPVLPPLALV
jgi:hypothetical protein